MALLIDTAVVAASERVDYWSNAARDVYHPVQIATDAGDRFSARMWGDEVSSIGLFRLATAPNTMSRTAKQIAAGDPECLHLKILLRGRMQTAQGHRSDVLGPGDMTMYDTSQPAVFRADESFEAIVVRLPKETLGAHSAKMAAHTALRIPGTCGLPRLAAQFFCGVAAGLADGTIAGDDVNVAERIIDLVRGVYADRIDADQPVRLRSRTELLLHAKAYVETNLGDPCLAPAQIARACSISTRYLHRLFEQEGQTVSEWIRTERLHRCRHDLLDPAFADHTIIAIATRWGLPNLPHFSRLFRNAYGSSPREFRAVR
ncbi:MAG TPA: helix-turn-helix domain-containing protein [Solirubrobacteraceae bacterium]|jgi:AraC-like DNA-binding protein